MHELKKKVKKELDQIGEKGLTSSNLEATNKLVDIYKDILEICEKEGGDSMYERGRYEAYDARDGRSRGSDGRYNTYYPQDDRFDRYFTRMRDGIDDYNAGRMRYRDGGSNDRMVDGIEMTMGAIVSFIEQLMDIAETPQEKEIVRKHVDKIRKM